VRKFPLRHQHEGGSSTRPCSPGAAAELALVGFNAALGQANLRRLPARRLLRRRY
jgi:hypothetical protein